MAAGSLVGHLTLPMTTGRRAIHEIAAAQHAHFATWQCELQGLGRNTTRLMRAAGEIITVHRGVHRLRGMPDTFQGRVMAAILACGPRGEAAAAQLTALQVHGLGRAFDLAGPSELLHVVVQDTTPRKIPGVVVHRTVDLGYTDVVAVDGIACTTGERSLVDLQPILDEVDHTSLLDDAVCMRVARRRKLYRDATRLLPGRPGLERIRELTHPEAAEIFRSWLEREFHQQIIVGRGFPVPDYNVRLYDEDGFLGIVDVRFQEQLVVVELEGLRFHTTPSQRRRDAERFNRLGFSPYRALRYTWRDVVERPDYVAGQLAKALRLSSQVQIRTAG